MDIYYFSLTGQTRRLVNKLNATSFEITDYKQLTADRDFILIVPTYAEEDPRGNYSQSILDSVFDFMDEKANQQHCQGVIGTGNMNFGDLFCWTAKEISRDYNVPVLLEIEFSGNEEDLQQINQILNKE